MIRMGKAVNLRVMAHLKQHHYRLASDRAAVSIPDTQNIFKEDIRKFNIHNIKIQYQILVQN